MQKKPYSTTHGLRTPREEIAFTARPKIHSHSQIFRYSWSIFCLPYRPNFSGIFDLCLNWVSIEIISMSNENQLYYSFWEFSWNTHLEISSVKILLTYLLTFAVAWSYYVIYFITKMNSCLHSRTDSHLRLGFMGHQTRELLHSTPFTTPQWFQNSF